ncbi:hypothetical protein MBANPS3_000531 [Mucor bainieri]
MNHFQKLPYELQFNIFNRIKDNAQLAACRLVCKQWDPIAERAIFSKTLLIKGDESFIAKLYYHLTTRPALALLIKSIDMTDHYYNGCSLLYEKFLNLLMTSSLEQIQGNHLFENSANLVCQIILNAPHKFNKIKKIPLAGTNDLSRQCLFALTDSLEYMYLSIYDVKATFIPEDDGKSIIVLDHLNQFTKLDYFALIHYTIQDITELDIILRRLKNATKLYLCLRFEDENDIPKSSDEMTAWLTQNVEKDKRMKSITDLYGCSYKGYWCNLVEYLAYKYPHLQSLKLNSLKYGTDTARVLRATKHIPHLILEDWELDIDADALYTVGHMMKSSSNTLKIDYVSSRELFTVNACREDSIQSSQFSFLLGVGSDTSKITKAVIDLHSPEYESDQDTPENLLTLYDILRLVPDVQDLEIINATIEYQELGTKDLVLNDLQHVQFHLSKIDHRVTAQLGSIAPNLDRLTISNSSIVVGESECVVLKAGNSSLF